MTHICEIANYRFRGLFLAIQIDLYSRLVIGWVLHQHNNAELLLVTANG